MALISKLSMGENSNILGDLLLLMVVAKGLTLIYSLDEVV